MTKLNFTVAVSTASVLTVTEATGYYDAGTNPNGFLLESDSSSVAFGVYKLSYGYFLNVLTYNKYNQAPIIQNTTEAFYKVPSPISTTYNENFTATNYTLPVDGTYTLKRIFIISDAFYAAHSSSDLFVGKTIYYTDGSTIFKVVSSVPVAVALKDFILADLTSATAISKDITFITNYYLSNCYFKVMATLLDMDVEGCDTALYDELTKTKDIIYMTLETIKYLKEVNNITQIQKLIEAVENCCGVCSSLPVVHSFSSTSCRDCHPTSQIVGGCGCG